MPEISEQEHEVLIGAKRLMDGLLGGKDTRRDFQRMVKKFDPKLTIHTDDEVIEPALEAVNKLGEKLDKFISSQTDEKIDAQLDADFGQLRTEGFTDDGIEQVKKIMVERHIKSPIDAAAVWYRRNPPKPQEPAGFQPSGWFDGVDRDEDLKSMFKDEDAWADNMARQVWAEEAAKNQVRT